MSRIAYLLSADVMPGRDGGREDAWEVHGELAALTTACAARGMKLVPAIWDEARDWSVYDAAIVRGTWDYMTKPDAFLPALEGIAAQTPLFNSVETARRNIDKSYLMELTGRGAPAPPTILADRATPDAIEAAFETLDAEDIVVKPLVGAAAWRQARLRRGEAALSLDALPPGRCLIQAFLPSLQSEGEYTFLYFNGSFSHALVKHPAQGDYRSQSVYGAKEAPIDPTSDQLAAADAALAALGEDLLYARVDLVRGPGGGWLVMELELIEPYFYLPLCHDGEAAGADRFAAALAARL